MKIYRKKKESNLNQAIEQIYQTIIKINTQQNQRLGITNPQRRINLHVSEFRPQR